jgi:hypothetical protein
MTRIEFRAFLSLLMCADPWPAGNEDHEIIVAWADKRAQEFGFANWITAYLEWENDTDDTIS